MATEVNKGKLLTQVKRGASLPEAASALGLPVSVVGPHFYKAEVEANPKLKFNATPASVVKAHDEEGLRWDRIAARTGKSVAEVKKLYAEKRDLADAYTGRGRKPGNGSSKPAGRGSASRASGSGSGRGSGRNAPAATRRGRGRASATATASPARRARAASGGKARTRAARAAKSGNPS